VKEDSEGNLFSSKCRVLERRAIVARQRVATKPKQTEIGTESD